MHQRSDVRQTVGGELPDQIRTGTPIVGPVFGPMFSFNVFRTIFVVIIFPRHSHTGLQSRRVHRLSGLRGHTQARRLRVQCPAELGLQEQIRHVPEGRVRAVGVAGVGRPPQ